MKIAIEKLGESEIGQKIIDVIGEEELYRYDPNSINSLHVDAVIKHSREQKEKLKVQFKKVDYLIRAQHEVEIPLLQKHAEQEKCKNDERSSWLNVNGRLRNVIDSCAWKAIRTIFFNRFVDNGTRSSSHGCETSTIGWRSNANDAWNNCARNTSRRRNSSGAKRNWTRRDEFKTNGTETSRRWTIGRNSTWRRGEETEIRRPGAQTTRTRSRNRKKTASRERINTTGC